MRGGQVTNEPEPTGWELLRGVKEVKDSVDAIALGMVTQIQHAAATARLDRLETAEAEQRKTRAQQWFAIGLAILGVVGTIVGGLILASLTRGTA
jgi:hypothetical protein